jgi:hypothetical protein
VTKPVTVEVVVVALTVVAQTTAAAAVVIGEVKADTTAEVPNAAEVLVAVAKAVVVEAVSQRGRRWRHLS